MPVDHLVASALIIGFGQIQPVSMTWLFDSGTFFPSTRQRVVESFFGTFKTELTHHEDYQTTEQARQSVFEYVEVFYNRQRKHSSLGYVAPVQFEAAA